MCENFVLLMLMKSGGGEDLSVGGWEGAASEFLFARGGIYGSVRVQSGMNGSGHM